MNSFAGLRTITLAVLLATGSVFPVAVQAQQKELSVEELEKYIEEQKAELAKVEANREETEAKAREVRDAIAEQDARKARVQEELNALCKEQEEITPGTYDECAAEAGN